ncbi:hypothetical protein EHS25_000071 [Saitozyma podzolica]|uniref:Uncharacterized protein n=1 Tax=Saitozyma podzolica TaxID=1890683 RepID=A0A427YVB9_9TREE|nr:hypothetical protein EHS25_000071 [Saitozyma podzolica]
MLQRLRSPEDEPRSLAPDMVDRGFTPEDSPSAAAVVPAAVAVTWDRLMTRLVLNVSAVPRASLVPGVVPRPGAQPGPFQDMDVSILSCPMIHENVARTFTSCTSLTSSTSFPSRLHSAPRPLARPGQPGLGR